MPLPELFPGDCLLYRPSGVFGRIIAVKTWTKISHIEVYAGDGMSVASRDGKGVNAYAVREAGLGYVLRPTRQPVDITAGMAWFNKYARGQAYDWRGLLIFTLAVKQGALDRMFCSEFGVRFYRACGMHCFAPHWDADRTPPSMFYASPGFTLWWSDGGALA